MFSLLPLILLGASFTLSGAAPVTNTPTAVSGGPICPYTETKVSVGINVKTQDGTKIPLTIRFLANGAKRCVYNVDGGFVNPDTGTREPAVLKMPRLDNPEKTASKNEIAALADNKLLFGAFTFKDSDVIVTKRTLGKLIFETRAWGEKFPQGYNTAGDSGFIACRDFMWDLYDKMAKAATRFGPWDPSDLHWLNALWTDDLRLATIVDLGMAKPIEGDVSSYWGRQTLRNTMYLQFESALPVEDARGPN
ncbi:hypothetical protein FRB99_000233, partial [Tulasnella sp. 403]